MSGDFTFYTDDPDFLEHQTIVTWNAALGFEWYILQKMPIRWGVYTNNANTPAVQDGPTDQAISVNMYGATAGISFMGQQSSITLTGSYAWGRGEGQIVSGSTNVQDVTQQAFSFYLSASYQL
jgi:hypothetical protein